MPYCSQISDLTGQVCAVGVAASWQVSGRTKLARMVRVGNALTLGVPAVLLLGTVVPASTGTPVLRPADH